MFHETTANIIVEKQDNIACLTLNRPDVLNALSFELLKDLQQELCTVRDDDTIEGLFITGAGTKAFSAGADIAALHTFSPIEVRKLASLAVSVNNQLETLDKVSIALINGFALGGGLELAESCMLRLAVEEAKMGHPEVRIGAVSGWGGTTRLPRLVGRGRAAELLLTGKMISAKSAYEMGLVNGTATVDTLRTEGNKLMGEILANGPLAVRFSWEAMHRGMNMSLEESAQLGADYFGLAAATEDFREGTTSFLDKTTPDFKGK